MFAYPSRGGSQTGLWARCPDPDVRGCGQAGSSHNG
jgi:hypothetical protein